MNCVQIQDINEFKQHFEFADDLQGAKFLITGATGLIGSMLIHCLINLDRDIEIIAPVRNIQKALVMFDEAECKHIRFIECSLDTFDYSSQGSVDYIIHSAAPTSSRFFVEEPVDTFTTIIDVTRRLLDYATDIPFKSFVYLSSLEVYSTIHDDSKPVDESVQGYLDPLSVRSSYPMAKRAAENLCCLYASQYGVNAKIARLTQTTGAGISKDDNRVIVQFVRLVSQGEDIILHSTGESARPYCYIIDSISALLYIMLRGSKGEAYNVANEATYISARDMALYLQKNFNSDIEVRTELDDDMGYAPVTKLRLSTKKLETLGWKPRYGLNEIFTKLIKVFAAL